MMPFLFMTEDAQGVKTWYVKIASFDYVDYASRWMHDFDLGDFCLVPDVDQTQHSVKFDTESKALTYIAHWWKTR